MIEQALIVPIMITKQKEKCFFEVVLPKNVKRIIGVETGFFLTIPESLEIPYQLPLLIALKKQQRLGVLQLQELTTQAVVYTKEIYTKDFVTATNRVIDALGSRDSRGRLLLGYQTPNTLFYADRSWLMGKKSQEEQINLPNSDLLKGIFTDTIGAYLEADINYTVLLHLWTAIN
jgi:hypothetical protein